MDNGMQVIHQKNFLIKVVNQEMNFRKWWKLRKEFKAWMEALSEEQLSSYLTELRVLTQQISPETKPEPVGVYFARGAAPSSQTEPLLKERRSEAVAYFMLALWKSLEVHKLGNPSPTDGDEAS
jgi:hypothetical protein